MLATLENSAVAIGLEKVNTFILSQRRTVLKNIQTAGQLPSF